MDHTFNFSIWEQESYLAPRDVLVAGGGFVGLWSAWFLRQMDPRLRIAVVDKDLFPTGASTRNAGFACFGSPGEILRDEEELGPEAAWALVDMRYRGLELMKSLIPPSFIDYTPSGGYECFFEDRAWERVLDGLDHLNGRLRDLTGYVPVFTSADRRIAEQGLRGFRHMIANSLDGSLHPGKLVQALSRMVAEAGVTLLPSTEVTGWEEGSGEVRVRTANGIALRASKLLVCTNGSAGDLLKDADVYPARGQILVTEPIPDLALKGTFHFDEGYYYFRNLDGRILLGGARNSDIEGETTAVAEPTGVIQETLERFLREHLLPEGTSVGIAHRWAGIMGMGSRRLPLIEQIAPRVYCAVRLSGIGVATSPMVARQAALLVTGAE